MEYGLRQSTVNLSKGDIDYAKGLARKMFDMYDKDRSTVIESHEIGPMIQDAYRGMNKTYNPSKLDIDGYGKIMDKNGDGKVTLADLENLCVRYLVGEAGLSQNLTSGNYKNYEETAKRSVPGSYNALDSYGGGSYSTGTGAGAYGGTAAGSYGGTGAGAYGGTGTGAGAYGGAGAGSYTTGANEYVSDQYTTTVTRTYEYESSPYLREVDKKSAISATLPMTASGNYGAYQSDSMTKSAIYIQRGKLDQIRRVFDKFDEDGNGFIDERELKKLMEETYNLLGVSKVITNEDVQSYLLMIDSKDGRVSYPEYERIVTRALARINVKFE